MVICYCVMVYVDITITGYAYAKNYLRLCGYNISFSAWPQPSEEANHMILMIAVYTYSFVSVARVRHSLANHHYQIFHDPKVLLVAHLVHRVGHLLVDKLQNETRHRPF